MFHIHISMVRNCIGAGQCISEQHSTVHGTTRIKTDAKIYLTHNRALITHKHNNSTMVIEHATQVDRRLRLFLAQEFGNRVTSS